MINGKIDLRSDTVTVPTEQMRQAMFEAQVGDDVYGDDPTVNRLQQLAAEMFGKEGAIFVPSGTMSNQLALFCHVERGQEIILPDECHVVVHECGAPAVLAGAQLRCIQCVNGEMPLEVIERSIRKDPTDIHQPSTGLITYENADSNGKVRSISYMKAVKELAEKYHLPVHIDGARYFNAAAFLETDVKEMAQYCDTLSVCLSKGLCAPIGTVLLGPAEFIEKARRRRKLLGGGMRQAGFLAAAGILALEKMSGRLKEDHQLAQYLADRLEEIKGIEVMKDRRDINMVFFRMDGYSMAPEQLVEKMRDNNILINGADEGVMRFVTHNYVTKEEIDQVIDLMKQQ